MKSFIVTFYRQGGKEDPDEVIGTLEEAGVPGEKKFTSMKELYGFLGRSTSSKEEKGGLG